MSASDSDESISTEEQLELVENKKASVERIKPKPKRKMSEKQLENLRKGREARAKGKFVKLDGKEPEPATEPEEPTPEPVPAPKRVRKTKPKPPKREKSPEPTEPEPPEEEYVPPPGASAPIDIPVKKPRGRPRKDPNAIIQEKIVYLAPIGANGAMEKVTVKPVKITPKNLKRHENIVKSKEISEKDATEYKLKRNGTIDGRSMNRGAAKKRTEKQIAAAKALGERTKAKYAKLREEKEKQLKTVIEDSIIDVVSQPVQKVKERKAQERKSVEQVEKEKLAKNKSLFS